jgi:hypothetical protein
VKGHAAAHTLEAHCCFGTPSLWPHRASRADRASPWLLSSRDRILPGVCPCLALVVPCVAAWSCTLKGRLPNPDFRQTGAKQEVLRRPSIVRQHYLLFHFFAVAAMLVARSHWPVSR